MVVAMLLKIFTVLLGAIAFVRVMLLRNRKPLTKEAYDRLQDQVVVITGASSGLGEGRYIF